MIVLVTKSKITNDQEFVMRDPANDTKTKYIYKLTPTFPLFIKAFESHKILYWPEIQQKSLFMMQHPHKTNIIIDTFNTNFTSCKLPGALKA